MKKITLLLISLLTASVCYAQGGYYDSWDKNYLNLGFVETTMSQDGRIDLKSNYGSSFTIGRTFFLHRPIGGFLCFGIDATWLNVDYTNFKIKHITDWETSKYTYHQGEISMHIGPSVTIRPWSKLSLHGYYRYAPSLSVLYANDAIYGNYAPFFVGGVSISCGAIGLGVESRTVDCKYDDFHSYGEGPTASDGKVVNKTWKAYLTYRF